MKTITWITQKGGSGKPTVALNLAVVAGRGKKKAVIFDVDPQQTAAKWYERRENEQPGVAALSPTQLPDALKRAQDAAMDYVFIDTAGRDDHASATAIKHADFCLVVCRPTPADMEALEPTIEGLSRQNKPFAFVITQAPASGFRIREAE